MNIAFWCDTVRSNWWLISFFCESAQLGSRTISNFVDFKEFTSHKVISHRAQSSRVWESILRQLCDLLYREKEHPDTQHKLDSHTRYPWITSLHPQFRTKLHIRSTRSDSYSLFLLWWGSSSTNDIPVEDKHGTTALKIDPMNEVIWHTEISVETALTLQLQLQELGRSDMSAWVAKKLN